MSKITNYFKGVTREARRVKWPTKSNFLPAISVVLVITIFAAIFLSIEDLASATIINQLRSAFEGLRG
ncbi:MAG: preprotein translocase subunit SecE [Bacilli bacterium]